jgi:hypothetical protein
LVVHRVECSRRESLSIRRLTELNILRISSDRVVGSRRKLLSGGRYSRREWISVVENSCREKSSIGIHWGNGSGIKRLTIGSESFGKNSAIRTNRIIGSRRQWFSIRSYSWRKRLTF